MGELGGADFRGAAFANRFWERPDLNLKNPHKASRRFVLARDCCFESLRGLERGRDFGRDCRFDFFHDSAFVRALARDYGSAFFHGAEHCRAFENSVRCVADCAVRDADPFFLVQDRAHIVCRALQAADFGAQVLSEAKCVFSNQVCSFRAGR